MKIFDAHIHIAEVNETSKILNNSTYKNKYRIYDSIYLESIAATEEYIKKPDKFFAIPMFFKESNIKEANEYTYDFCSNFKNGVFVPLIDTDVKQQYIANAKVYKEHFLIHDFRLWEERIKFYSFLNDNGKYIIIHCKDTIRIEYLKKLRKQFPKLKIIIPHMGRNVFEDYDFTREVINAFYSDTNVFFDTSTVTNSNIIKYAISKVGCDRILFGSDFPLEFKSVPNLFDLTKIILKQNLSYDGISKILYHNAYNILSQ